MTHQEINLQIVEKLKQYFEKEENKDIRFCQGLFNLRINEFARVMDGTGNGKILPFVQDKHNEESIDTLDNLKEQE